MSSDLNRYHEVIYDKEESSISVHTSAKEERSIGLQSGLRLLDVLYHMTFHTGQFLGR